MQDNKSAKIIRALAKIGSLASLGFLSMFVVAHFTQGELPAIGSHEWLGLMFFPIGVMAGLLLSWWKEALGGWLTVGNLIAFYCWNLMNSGHLPGGPYFILLTLPGLMFLIANWLDSSVKSLPMLSQTSQGHH